VDPVDRVLPTMAPVLSEAAAAYLRAAGVDLRLGLKVEGSAPGRVCLSGAAGEIQLEAAATSWRAYAARRSSPSSRWISAAWR
jgi:NADH dehydrogenase FAD-containing subunit